jgi:1,4-dihydroxy-2-naphthoyl-CoA hydrolase
MSIWFKPITLEELNGYQQQTLVSRLGIRYTEIGEDYLKAVMPVDERTKQPAGILHGGASVALAETLGSTGANLVVDRDQKLCVGLEINANHVRAMREGEVTGTARPLHRGGTTQIWEIRISDAKDRLVCVSRITLAVLDRANLQK